jgi:uncharacterized protein involved in high-affinity Fe2+ transport
VVAEAAADRPAAVGVADRPVADCHPVGGCHPAADYRPAVDYQPEGEQLLAD